MLSKSPTSFFAIIALGCLWQAVNVAGQPNSKLFTGQACNYSIECKGSNVFCNEQKKCECQGIGNVPETFAGILTLCTRKDCETNAECTAIYGENARCHPLLKGCECDLSFTYSEKNRQCLLKRKIAKLGSKCTDNTDCGENAACGKGICKCKIAAVKVNNFACEEISCQTDEQCEKVTPSSVCHRVEEVHSGFCFCGHDTLPFHEFTECLPPFKKLGDPCRIGDCGVGAWCTDGRCKCNEGKVPSPTNGWNCVASK